jgi:hypothetical protein
VKSKSKSRVAPEKTITTKAKTKQVKVKEEGDVGRTTKKAPVMDDLLKDPRWTNVFLPSLAHALYVSRKPFKHFKSKAPEFLQVVQKIFNLSYQEIDLALNSKDELVKTVRTMSHNHTIHVGLTCRCHSGLPTHKGQESKACVRHSRSRDRIIQRAGIHQSARQDPAVCLVGSVKQRSGLLCPTHSISLQGFLKE